MLLWLHGKELQQQHTDVYKQTDEAKYMNSNMFFFVFEKVGFATEIFPVRKP